MTYSEKLKDPRWQKRRLEIMQRDEFTCRFCGDKETTLHVHHKKYTGEPWEAPSEDLKTLCEHCHEFMDVDSFEEQMKVKKIVFDTGALVYCLMDSRGIGFMTKLNNSDYVECPLALSFEDFKVISDFVKSNECQESER